MAGTCEVIESGYFTKTGGVVYYFAVDDVVAGVKGSEEGGAGCVAFVFGVDIDCGCVGAAFAEEL